ncbi:AI-2E family transporter [Crocinitomix algicola]|uniref:AI-2E family transporter n=1 Tax=Crocinitomix algicola TaxID=1740263 RepID=UPI0008732A4A|nr:AI-2E family transporter [Crocinitomix algicola]
MDLKRVAALFIILISIVFILIIGKNIFIPLILAILIWFLIKEIRQIGYKIPFIGAKIPKWLLNIISVIVLFVFLGFMVDVLVANIQDLKVNLPLYEKNLNAFNEQFSRKYHIDLQQYISDKAGNLNLTDHISSLLASFSELFGSTFMIALYLIFILLEESIFNKKILTLSKNQAHRLELENTLNKIGNSISRYIALKTFVSILTGTFSYIVLLIIGVDSALFWAFLIFVLNFIPTIGSLIGTIFPALMALLQFGSINDAILVLVCVGTIQVIIGNIVEPKIMGNSLNVSALVVILALSLWGAIWGITGMVLSVPITVILVILFEQFDSTRKVAILLSEKGDLNP